MKKLERDTRSWNSILYILTCVYYIIMRDLPTVLYTDRIMRLMDII